MISSCFRTIHRSSQCILVTFQIYHQRQFKRNEIANYSIFISLFSLIVYLVRFKKKTKEIFL